MSVRRHSPRFATIFSKVVCCRCIKMHLLLGKVVWALLYLFLLKIEGIFQHKKKKLSFIFCNNFKIYRLYRTNFNRNQIYFKLGILFQDIWYTFPTCRHILTHWACATMFSTLFNIWTRIYGEFLKICKDAFKVVRCRIVYMYI